MSYNSQLLVVVEGAILPSQSVHIRPIDNCGLPIAIFSQPIPGAPGNQFHVSHEMLVGTVAQLTERYRQSLLRCQRYYNEHIMKTEDYADVQTKLQQYVDPAAQQAVRVEWADGPTMRTAILDSAAVVESQNQNPVP